MKQVLTPIRMKRFLLAGMIVPIWIVVLPTTANAYMSSIASNFNGTDVEPPDYLWFNSHLTNVNPDLDPVTIIVRNQTITFTSTTTSIPYTLAVPDATIVMDSSTGTATTTFASGAWTTSVASDAGNPFMAGLAWQVPAGENLKAMNPVTWNADFYSSEITSHTISWQWSAAVYTTFTTNYSALGVLPIDGGGLQSGTPTNYTSYVKGGARGGGGANYTGSNSGTGSVVVPLPAAALLGLLGLGVAGWRLRKCS